jgi:hypothetical protein
MTLHDRIARKRMLSVPDVNIGTANSDTPNSQEDLAGFWTGRGNLPILDPPWRTHYCLPHFTLRFRLRFKLSCTFISHNFAHSWQGQN